MVCQKIRELLKHPVSKYRSSEFLFTDVIPKRDLLKNYEPDSKLSEDTTNSQTQTTWGTQRHRQQDRSDHKDIVPGPG